MEIMDFLRETIFYGNSLLRYIIFIGIFLLTFLIFNFALSLILIVLVKINNRFQNNFITTLVTSITKRSRPFIFLISIAISRLVLVLPRILSAYWDKIIIIALIVYTVLLICDIITNFSENYLLPKKGVVISDGIITIAKVFVWIIGILTILANLGVNVNTFLAGLGVGGVAVAFAAQSIVADLFNYFVIVFDKPFLKGDFIKVDQDLGTVEYIGVKSTRIRRNSGEQLLISNTNLLASRIQNYRLLEKRRKNMLIGVEYSTPLEKMKLIPDIIKNAIEEQGNTEFYSARFIEFADSSLNFEVIYYVLDADYLVYVSTVENINHKIMEEFAKINVNFAFPSRTLYVNNLNS